MCYRLYLPSILLTHPFDTWSIREISQGRAPEWASSTIFCLVESGNGRPPTNTPPNWLTPLWPETKRMQSLFNPTPFCYFLKLILWFYSVVYMHHRIHVHIKWHVCNCWTLSLRSQVNFGKVFSVIIMSHKLSMYTSQRSQKFLMRQPRRQPSEINFRVIKMLNFSIFFVNSVKVLDFVLSFPFDKHLCSLTDAFFVLDFCKIWRVSCGLA